MTINWSVTGVILKMGGKTVTLSWSEWRELQLVMREFEKINFLSMKEGSLVH